MPRARTSEPRRAPVRPAGVVPLGPRPPLAERGEGTPEQARLLGSGQVGAEALDPDVFRGFGDFAAERHLFVRMARPGPDRAEEVRALGQLLVALHDGARARRILEHLLRAERFFDIYPLEVLAEVLEAAPGYVPGVGWAPVVENKRFLETRLFEVEEVISFEVPLAARVRSFAVVGGATPGYCLSPGPPGRYELEIASPGRFEILVGARVRGADRVDRVRLWLEEGPESPAEW